METVNLSESGVGVASIKAAGALRRGGVIIYPTDTLYGLGADAFSDEAVGKIYAIKGRDPKKPIHAVFADVAMIEEYAELNDEARKLIAKFFPGPLTLVLKIKPGFDTGIGHNMQTVGVRIPNDAFCIETARSLGKPFTTTSANVAGQEASFGLEGVLTQLGRAAEEIDIAIDAGTLPMRPPSTVADVSSGVLKVLREGGVSVMQLQEAL